MPKAIDLNDISKTFDISQPGLQHYVTRYEKERYKHLLHYIHDDSRAIWISKNVIQAFFANNPSADGVRIYFGVIDDDHVGFKKGIHNLIFVSTRKTDGIDNDQLGADDCVIVLKNFMDNPITPPQAVICPPPKEHCNGNGLTYTQKSYK